MRKLILFLVVFIGLLVVLPAEGARHDLYPLHRHSAGPRVCGLQWLLSGRRPSVWRSTRYTTFKGDPNCIYGPRTTKGVYVMKYRLGYPLGALRPSTAGRFFMQLLEGKVRRPRAFIGRAFTRQKAEAGMAPFISGYPLAKRATVCGVPGVGTHSYISPPNNWQSDRALDLCVAYGTKAFTVGAGSICSGCGFGYFSSYLGPRFAGQRFTLNLNAGDQVYYAHLSRLAIRQGQRLARGGYVGLTGSANGVSHLHIACRYCNPYSLAP